MIDTQTPEGVPGTSGDPPPHDQARRKARLWRRLARSELRLGPGHPRRARLMLEISRIALTQRRLAEAEALAARALEIDRAYYGETHATTLHTTRWLVHFQLLQDKYAAAEAVARQALARCAEAPPDEPLVRAQLLVDLARAADGLGRADEAAGLVREALARLDEAEGPDPAVAVEVLKHCAFFYSEHHRQEEALALYRRLLPLCAEPSEGDEALGRIISRLMINTLALLGYQHAADGRWDAVIECGEEMAALDPERGFPYLATMCVRAGRFSQGLKRLEAACPEHPACGPLWLALGELYADAERHDDADTAYYRASLCAGMNAALLHGRAGMNLAESGDAEGALRHMAEVRRPELPAEHLDLYWRVRDRHMALLRRLGRDGEAGALALDVLAELGGEAALIGVEVEGEVGLALLTCLGRALLYGRNDPAGARRCALQAYRMRPEPAGLGLLRELAGQPAHGAPLLRIIARGQRRQTGASCTREYRVLADHPLEALAFIRAAEEEELEGLALVEWRSLPGDDEAAEGLKGIYRAGPYCDAPPPPKRRPRVKKPIK